MAFRSSSRTGREGAWVIFKWSWPELALSQLWTAWSESQRLNFAIKRSRHVLDRGFALLGDLRTALVRASRCSGFRRMWPDLDDVATTFGFQRARLPHWKLSDKSQ